MCITNANLFQKSLDDFENGDFRKSIPRYALLFLQDDEMIYSIHPMSLIHRFSNDNFPKLLEVVEAVSQIARKYDATPGQVGLAWLLAQGNDIIPIPGTRKVKVRAGVLRLLCI